MNNSPKRLVNLTPHEVSVYSPKDRRFLMNIPTSGQIARLVVNSTVVDTVDVAGTILPISQPLYGGVTGLPDPVDGVLYIVSRSIAFALKRSDLVHVGYRIRDNNDRLVGCDSFFAAPSGAPVEMGTSIKDVTHNG